MTDIRYRDIDWNRLWQKARKEKTSTSRTAGDWDKKAPSFARRNADSLYNRKFIEQLRPEPDWTILDVGCGPGTLAIPLAAMVRKVSALDFSPKMLEILEERIKRERINNISVHHLSWTDDWEKNGVERHDIAMASRSLAIDDLEQALRRLTLFARKEVVVTDRVGPGPFDPDAFQAVGRDLQTGPDYIITVNMLYKMGIHARVDFIRLEDSHRYASFAEALDNYAWMFNDPTENERQKLEKYLRSIAVAEKDHTISLHPSHITTWALIRWDAKS